jgi:hypothetical protein
VTVYPVPSWPYNVTPYLFVVLLIIGLGYMHWCESRHPGALRRGATMLVGYRTNAEGNVEWDSPTSPN